MLNWRQLFCNTFICWTLSCTLWDLTNADDGSWSSWTPWSSCSVTCGPGISKRYRVCDDPPPSSDGQYCKGKSRHVRTCQILVCPQNGGWTEWTSWSSCSVTCGEGQRFKTRTCTAPAPQFGGKNCEGEARESESCKNLEKCPRDGGWTDWSYWTPCSATCGQGVRSRSRSCDNPPPAADGQPCNGPKKTIAECLAPTGCPTNGQWSEWADWTACSVTCGQGQRVRVRSCDNPPAQNGGLPCDETDGHVQLKECNATILHCPVDGKWSEWSDWGACEKRDCKVDTEMAYAFRSRSCNNPIPANGGVMCKGTFLDAGICTLETNCKVDGNWGEWSDWECPEELAKRTRRCDNPPPIQGGKECPPDQATEFYTKAKNPLQYGDICGGDEEKADGDPEEDEEEEEEDFDENAEEEEEQLL